MDGCGLGKGRLVSAKRGGFPERSAKPTPARPADHPAPLLPCDANRAQKRGAMSESAILASSLATQRILIVEDHAVVRAGLIAELSSAIPADQLRAVADEEQARQALAGFCPTLCLLDLLLGGSRGLADSLGMIADFTRRPPSPRVLVYSAVEDADLARRALAAGARGYLTKSESMENLRLAIETVLGDRFYLSPAVFASLGEETSRSPTRDLDPRFALLTNRERHVLHATALGQPNRRIATELGLSVKTVETHKDSVKRKLDLRSSVELERLSQSYLAALLGLAPG